MPVPDLDVPFNGDPVAVTAYIGGGSSTPVVDGDSQSTPLPDGFVPGPSTDAEFQSGLFENDDYRCEVLVGAQNYAVIITDKATNQNVYMYPNPGEAVIGTEAGDLALEVNAGVRAKVFGATGNLVVGSLVDNLLDRGQFAGSVNTTTVYKVAGTQVVGPRQAAIANATIGTEVATINSILAAMRTHGLIAT